MNVSALRTDRESRWRLVDEFHCCSIHAGSRQAQTLASAKTRVLFVCGSGTIQA